MGTLERLCHLGEREHWLLDEEDIDISQFASVLGEGGYAAVRPGSFQGTPAAMKIPKDCSGPGLAVFFDELRVLRRLRHPNIALFFGAYIREDACILLVFERLLGNTLTVEVVPPPEGPSPAGRRQMLMEIGCALRFLHAQRPGIVHGDVKNDNVFVEHVGSGRRAKLLDFGLARVLTPHTEPLGFTLKWAAPEVHLPDMNFGAPSDVFSFGRLIYFVVVGREPLANCQRDEVLRCTHMGHVPLLMWPESCVPLQMEARSLGDACLKFDPELRPTMDLVQEELAHWQVC